MSGKFHHELIYCGQGAGPNIATQRLTLCGAGAIGSNLADHLARQGFASLRVIDRDRVEERNVSTQFFDESEIGLWKVEAIRNRCFTRRGSKSKRCERN